MAKTFRQLVVLIVALTLALAGAARSMPLVHAQGAEAMVICAGGGETTIYLDRAGNPVSGAEGAPGMDDCASCPDCLAAAAPGTLPPSVLPIPHQPPLLHVALPVVPVQPARPHLRPETRGPPPVAHGTDDLAFAAAPDAAATQWKSGPCQPDGQPKMDARI